MTGRTISHYRVVEKLGEGGMGVVYKAVDTRLDRPVAIKLLTGAQSAEPDRRLRFVQEAKAASALNHPNIITIYDTGTEDGVDFLAMEYVKGRTLQERIGRKGLPIAEAVGYLTQVASGLQAAHAAGIVHRDLKPANIIVADNGVTKLLDFGVAKLRSRGDEISAGETASAVQLTEPGMLIGTVAYMSPEQARGQPVDQRADIWAFGCVLFEALTGRQAFGGGSGSDTLSRILGAEPDWSALPADTPPGIRHLIGQCLRKDPERRLRHVDPVLLEPWPERGEPSRGRGLPVIAALAAVGLVIGGVIGWWAYSRLNTSAPAVQPALIRFTAPFVPAARAAEWNVPTLAVAPDGRSLAYVNQSTAGPPQLYLKRLDSTTHQALSGTEGAVGPFFSPDAKAIGFFAGGKLKKVTLADGVVQTLCDSPGQWGGAWGEDNSVVFASAGVAGLKRVSASGGTPEPLTQLGPGELAHRFPALMSGGRVVVFITSNTAGPGLEEPRVVVQSLDTGRREIVDVAGTFAMFSPDGQHLLVVRGGVLMAVPFDAVELKVRGTPIPVVENILQTSTGAAQIAISASTLAYLPGVPETRRLVWVDRQGRVEPLAAPPRLYVHPRLSPDGQRIAVMITEPKNDIWIYDIGRNVPTRLTFEGSNAYPIWTRDGTKVTYVSSRDGRPANLFWKSADGTGPEEQLLKSDRTQVSESWAPNETLLFVELRPPPTNWDIMTLSLSGARETREFQKTAFCDCTPQISPTGRFVAYTTDESGRSEVQIRSFPDDGGSKITVSNQGGAQAAWRNDEREIYYRVGRAMMVAAVTTEPRLSVGKPKVLFEGDFATIQGKNYDVTPDGQRFLMVRVDDRMPPTDVTVVLHWLDDMKRRLSLK